MKNFVLLLWFSLLISNAWSQQFEKQYTGAYRSICQSVDGNYLLGGTAPFEGSTAGLISLLRVAAINGNAQMEYTYGIAGEAFTSNYIFETADGGAYVCGTTTLDSVDGDPIVLRIDACGDPLWMRNLKSIFCPDTVSVISNWINYATLDGHDNLTLVIGFTCDNLGVINFDNSGNVRWANSGVGYEMGLFFGTNFARSENGNYLCTGGYQSYNADTVMVDDYRINAAVRFVDSNATLISEKYYYLDPGGSLSRAACDLWGSDGYLIVYEGTEWGSNILALSAEGDSLYAAHVESIDAYELYTREVFQAGKGQYLLAGKTCDTIPMLHSQLGAQLIDGYGNVIAQNTTDFPQNTGFEDALVTADGTLLELAAIALFDSVDGGLDHFTSLLVKFNQDLTNFIIIDSITPTSEVVSACGYDTSSMHFDLSPILDDYYAYTLPDSAIIGHEAGTDNDWIADGNILVFPNPATSSAVFKWPASQPVYGIEIYQANGVLISSVRIPEGELQWMFDCADLPAGLYAYRINKTTGSTNVGWLSVQ